jgi:hypothetical protein
VRTTETFNTAPTEEGHQLLDIMEFFEDDGGARNVHLPFKCMQYEPRERLYSNNKFLNIRNRKKVANFVQPKDWCAW